MKKLYFLLPIAMWIADYFLLKVTSTELTSSSVAIELWWIFTDIFAVLITLALFGLAIVENS